MCDHHGRPTAVAREPPVLLVLPSQLFEQNDSIARRDRVPTLTNLRVTFLRILLFSKGVCISANSFNFLYRRLLTYFLVENYNSRESENILENFQDNTAHSSTLSLFNGRVCIGGKRGVVSVVRVPWGRLMHTYSLSLSCSGRRNEMEEAGDRTRRVGSNKRQIYSSE